MFEEDKADLFESLSNNESIKSKLEINKVVDPLRREIDLIPDEIIREYVSIILYYSEHFWDSAASNVEDHYPPDEYGRGGLVLHTQRTVRAMFCVISSTELEEEDISVLMAAAVLHAVCKPVSNFDIDSDKGQVFDSNYMVNIDNYILEAFQKAIKDKVYPLITNDMENKYELILNRIIRLIHCSEGTFSPIPELYPSTTLEAMFASAQIVAKSLHVIADGFDVKDERWNLGN